MYRTAARGYGQAGAQYRHVDVTSRIEGASPHRLVGILFEELLTSIAATRGTMDQPPHLRRADDHSRALAILTALESSLDFEKGGEIATMLASVYHEARRLLIAGMRDRDRKSIDDARKLIAEIAAAWDAIG